MAALEARERAEKQRLKLEQEEAQAGCGAVRGAGFCGETRGVLRQRCGVLGEVRGWFPGVLRGGVGAFCFGGGGSTGNVFPGRERNQEGNGKRGRPT